MKEYFARYTSAAPLAVMRIVLGGLLFVGVIRFWANGWIKELYILPKFHFTFYGFEFVRPLSEGTYVLFAVCGCAALMVALGLYYRMAIIVLFLSFTYIELIDKSTYLNHYYFISMICLMMIFLPAHGYFSIDAYRNRRLQYNLIPSWTIDVLRLFVAMVYVYAGLAKFNSDWLLHAQPLRIWLPSRNDMFLIGPLFSKLWVAYAFSWIGFLYDLTVPLWLFYRPTRWWAFGAVLVFHLMTALLFPIGMFPYVMIGTSLIFFPASAHENILTWMKQLLTRLIPSADSTPSTDKSYVPSFGVQRLAFSFFLIFFTFQIATPWRYLLYPDELFWTEEGYRFSWRVMLMEKAGFAEFTVRDSTGYYEIINNDDYLTPLQQKMMSAQPDMVLQYAHFLRDHYRAMGMSCPEVFVDSYVALNGRLGRPMIDPRINLANVEESFAHKSWVLPLNDEIRGL